MARPEWLPVLDLLVRDESNPRSIAFQLVGLHDYVRRIGSTYRRASASGMAAAVDALDGDRPRRRPATTAARACGELLEEW